MSTNNVVTAPSNVPKLLPLAIVGTLSWMAAMSIFLTSSMPSLHTKPVFAGIIAGFAALVVLLYGNAKGTPHVFAMLMGLLAVIVTGRMLVVAASWNMEQVTILSGGVTIALFAWSGWNSAFPPPAPTMLEPRWVHALTAAKNAQTALVIELKAHEGLSSSEGLLGSSKKLLTAIDKAAHTWSRLEKGAPSSLQDAIAKQLEDTRVRANDSRDEMSKQEWLRTAEALSNQLEAIRRIARNGDRALARVQCQVTQMETARLCLMAYAAQDASLRAEETQRLVMQFESASADLDVTAGALEDAQAPALLSA